MKRKMSSLTLSVLSINFLTKNCDSSRKLVYLKENTTSLSSCLISIRERNSQMNSFV